MRSLLTVFILVLTIFVFVPTNAHAYLLEQTDCDPEDPTYNNGGNCQENCNLMVASQPGVATWCEEVVGTCSYETNLAETTNVCNCSCADPQRDIQCVDNSDQGVGGYGQRDCSNDRRCVAGGCILNGSDACDPNDIGASLCYAPHGPCDPASSEVDIAYCVDEDLDGQGVCVCSTGEFLGEDPPSVSNAIYCTDLGNPTTNPGSPDNPNRLYTAFGCIRIDKYDKTVEFFIKWSIGIVGGTALIMLTYATLQVVTSSGNPDKLKAAKELFMAVLGSILLLILSVTILRIIGVEILILPGL